MYGPLCAEFYDADKQFATPGEVAFYKSIFKKGDLILEPMCGSGRLLIPLMKEGYMMHGIDNSHYMLQSCRDRASRFGLRPVLFEQKVEDAFLTDLYGGVIIPLGSFQLFYPREVAFQILDKIRTCLKPNGKLVMDLSEPRNALGENNDMGHSHREVQTNNNTVIKLNDQFRINKREQFVLHDFTYTKWVDGQVVSQEKEQMFVCWYYRDEMELILKKCGFRILRCEEQFLNNQDQISFIAELR